MSWASVDSPEESPDQSLVYQVGTDSPHKDTEMTVEAGELIDQVNCMEKEIFSLKNESVIIMKDIENFNRENLSLKEKQKTLRKQIKFNSESFLSKLLLNEETGEIQQLRRKIVELENNLAEVEQKYKCDKIDLTEKNKYFISISNNKIVYLFFSQKSRREFGDDETRV